MSADLPTDPKSELELEKLRLEVVSLRRSLRPWYLTASALVVAGGGVLALLTVLMQWRIALLDVDRAEWKTAQIEQRERDAIRSLEAKDREMTAVSSRFANVKEALERTQSEVSVLQSERSSLEGDAAKRRSELTGLRHEIIRTQEARKHAESEVSVLLETRLSLKNEVAILDSKKTELLTGIMNDATASTELKKAARTVIRAEYARKRAQWQDAFLTADKFATIRLSSGDPYFQRAADLRKETEAMETRWPWLRESAPSGTPE